MARDLEGYKNGKPDANWWRMQIKAGDQYRFVKARQDNWFTYTQFYRNHFAPGIFTKNIFFTMRRSLVPRTYFRNPSISVTPAKPGIEQVALARVMERTFNSLIRTMDMKTQMQRMVDTAFVTGSAAGKLGFGAIRTPTPAPGGTEAPIMDDGRRFEHRMGIEKNMPWFMAVTDMENMIYPQNCRETAVAWFQAHRMVEYRDDILYDPRFKGKLKEKKKELEYESLSDPVIFASESTPMRDTITLTEIRDRRNRKVILMALDEADEPLFFEDDELQTIHSSPWYLYTPNPDVSTIWGVPDAAILHQYQAQLNEIKTKMHWHMRKSLIKFIAKKGNIQNPEKLFEEDVSALVEATNPRDIQMIQMDAIPKELFQMEQEVMQDIRETMGFNRNAFGEYQARSHGPTATETRAVQRALDLRMDERRDRMADILQQVMTDVQKIIFRHWGTEQVMKVLDNQGAAHWVAFTGKMLRQGDYEIRINPDSAIPESKEVREQRAKEFYMLLRDNPLVNNINLTKFLLGELPGVTLEDLLLQEPTQTPNPMNMQQFAGILNQQGAPRLAPGRMQTPQAA